MGLTRDVLKHSAIYSFATILGRLISFVMLPFYAKIFQTEGYGIIGMVDASLGILGIIFASGFHVAILRIYHEEDAQRKKLVVSTAVRLIWGLALGAIILPLIFSPQLSRIFLGGEQYSILLVLALVTFLLEVTGQSASTFLIINQKSILYSTVSILRLVIGLALNIWLVIVLNVGLIGVFISSLVTAAVASSIFHCAAYKAHGFAFDRPVARKLLKFQMPLMPGEIIAFLSRQTERFLVRFIIDIRGVGILEMAYKFPPLLNLLVSMPFTQAWRTKSFEIAEQPEAPRIIGRMFTNYIYLMVFSGMLLALCIEDILKIMTPAQFWEAVGIARIEIVTTILAAANAFLLFGLYYRNKTQVVSTIKSAIALVKILISALMIYYFRLKGAAYSALIAETILLTVISFKSLQCYPVKLELKKLTAIIGGAVILFYSINYINNTEYYKTVILNNDYGSLVDYFINHNLFGHHTSHRIAEIIKTRMGNVMSLLINMISGGLFILLIPYLKYNSKFYRKTSGPELIDTTIL